MILAQRLELLFRLRRNYVVMPVKIEGSFASTIAKRKNRGMIIGVAVTWKRHHAFALQAQFPGSAFKQLSKLTTIFARRILRGHGDKFGQQLGNVFFTLPKPPDKQLDILNLPRFL